mgnify:CR=1 FL=1
MRIQRRSLLWLVASLLTVAAPASASSFMICEIEATFVRYADTGRHWADALPNRRSLPWVVPCLLAVASPASPRSLMTCAVCAASARPLQIASSEPVVFVVDVDSKRRAGHGGDNCRDLKEAGQVFRFWRASLSPEAMSLVRGDKIALTRVTITGGSAFIDSAPARTRMLLEADCCVPTGGCSGSHGAADTVRLQRLSKPWHQNLVKRLVRRPKLHFWDTWLLCHSVEISFWRWQRSPPCVANLNLRPGLAVCWYTAARQGNGARSATPYLGGTSMVC